MCLLLLSLFAAVALRAKQNRNNIKLYQATGTNRWDRPPLPQKYNEQGRNHVGTALDMRDKN